MRILIKKEQGEQYIVEDLAMEWLKWFAEWVEKKGNYSKKSMEKDRKFSQLDFFGKFFYFFYCFLTKKSSI